MQARSSELAADERVGQERFAALLHRRQQVLIQLVEIALDLCRSELRPQVRRHISKRRDAEALASSPRTPDARASELDGDASRAACRRRSSSDSRRVPPAGAPATLSAPGSPANSAGRSRSSSRPARRSGSRPGDTRRHCAASRRRARARSRLRAARRATCGDRPRPNRPRSARAGSRAIPGTCAASAP